MEPTKTPKKPAPNRIRELRERAGLSQEELAALTNLDFTTISHHESGSRRPNPRNLESYAKVFKVPSWQILLDPESVMPDMWLREQAIRKEIFAILDNPAVPYVSRIERLITHLQNVDLSVFAATE